MNTKEPGENTNLFPSEQGRMIYWHIGNRRKANAIVAITEKKREKTVHYTKIKCIEHI